MADLRKHSSTSQRFRVVMKHATTGAGLTGLTEASAGLIISTIVDNEASTTRYSASSSEIETIATLGTYAAPSSNKCRFREVDATNHPGLYEIQLADARLSVASGLRLVISWSGATNLLAGDYEVQLTGMDVYDAVRGGMTSLPNAAAEASGGLATLSAAQASNGTINVNVHRWLTGTPNALQSGRVDSYLGAAAAGVIAAATFAANALDAVWSTATRVLTAGTNIVLAKGTGVTGFNDLSAAQVNAEADTALADVGLTTTVTGRIDVATSTRSSHSASDVWAVGTRTLTSFGTLVADVTTAVWAATTRILTAGTNIVLAKGTGVTGFNDLDAAQVKTQADQALADAGVTTTVTGRIDVATSTRSSHSAADVWAVGTRTLTSFGTLVADVATAVWAAGTRTLTSISALAAELRAALGLGAANLDTQLGDIPTVAEFEARTLTTADRNRLAAHLAGVLTFEVGSGGSTTEVPLDSVNGAAPSSVNNFYKDAVMVFTSGALAGQRTSISSYDGGTGVATVVALTGAPAAGVVGVIV